MKSNRRNPLLRALQLTSIALIFSHSAQAATGTWNVNANGNWSTATNWTGSIIANDASSIANFTFNITADRTVTLDSSRTINKLVFTDLTTASHNWILARSGTSVLTMGGTTPTIDVTNRTATISAVLTGTTQITKAGVGTLILSGDNTFNAGISLTNGPLQLNAANAAGTGAITLGAGTAGNGPRVVINGGITIGNAINIPATAGATGLGVIQHTGSGVARVNGALTITGGPSGGGHFVGGGAAGSELYLGGAINSTITGLSQRDGRVVYAGGGTGGSWTNLTVTNTALVGATNGIPTGVSIFLGGSGSASLDLNGFDQTINGLVVGNTGVNTFTGTVNIGAKTLGLNGALTSQSNVTQTVTHNINATAGSGVLALGALNRTFTIPDTTAAVDLAINNATITGTAGFTKTDTGTLALNNVTTSTPITISTGALTLGSNIANTITPQSLTLAAGTTLNMDVGTGGDLISSNAVSSAGATIVLRQFGAALPNGSYPLISYTGTSPGLANFSVDETGMGHAIGDIEDTGTAIAYKVTGNDTIYWTGTTSNDWATGTTTNWKLNSNNADTDYFNGDDVTFANSPTSTNVTIGANIVPSKVTFTNTSGTDYILTGAGGIAGTTSLTKTGSGNLTLATPNSYTGITSLSGGNVIADFTTGSAIPATSSITMTAGTNLTFAHNGGTFALSSPTLTGGGTVTFDPGVTTAGNRDIGTVTWDASGFNGLMRLAPTTGTMRIQVNNINDIGTGPIEIASGGQIIATAASLTIPNSFTLTGTGYSETAGTLGSLRANNPTTFTGTLTVSGSTKIGALGGNAIVTNTLTGGDLTFGGSNNNNPETLTITGDASGLSSLTVNDGTATGNANSILVAVGNATTTGTLGNVPITLKPDGFKNAVIRFDRSDSYTLGGAITSVGTAPANEVRSFVDLDTTGTGFSDGGLTTSLGLASPASGGRVRVGFSRADAVANLSGNLTAELINVSAGQNNATLNINNGANISLNQFHVGESANNSGTVNQATGSTVNVLGQLRVGHFGTESSTYNLNGGTLTLSGATPNASPSTPTGGGANAYGDNNLNTLAVNTILGGGIYVGIDGQGTFNHNGGTATMNWMVLDNRGATGSGLNMLTGIDSYNISGTSTLNLRSTYGLIGRNDGSYEVNLGGGTIRIDNSGSGAGTGPNIVVPLDAILTSAATTTTTLDTNASVNIGNAFSLTKNVTGTGTLALTGGGTINLDNSSFQSISANLSSSGTTANINKLGSGTTQISGGMAGFTGNVTVSAGRLDVPNSLDTAVTVSSGATLGGDISLATLTLNGGTVLFDPNDSSPHSATSLVLNGVNQLAIGGAPGVGTFPALTYGSASGGGSLVITNGSSFRTPPIVSDNLTGTISVQFFAGESLTWTGSISSTWDINTTSNWSDGVNPEFFFSGDSVTFPTGAANTSVTLTGLLAPAGVSVTSDDTTNYTLTSAASNQLSGTTGITKTGTSALTLVGPNIHGGITSIGGGRIAITDPTSLGNGLPGNSISLSNGGILSYTGATATDLGSNRSIAVGTGGGAIVHDNAVAATITIPGALSGNTPLSLQSVAAGGGTFSLTGSNSGYTGAMSVNASSTGLSTLFINGSASAPGSGSITLNYPANGVNGNTTTLSLPGGTILPAGLAVELTSAAVSPVPPTIISLRTQIITNANVTINGPVKLAGSSIIQTSPGTGSTLTINGNITESSPGSFLESPLQAYSNVLFLRGLGTNVVNGQINLPSAGSTVSVTDGATTIINSTGNVFQSASAVHGILRIGADNALPTTARLVIGQAGNQACTLDLNGFDQTVTGLEWQAPTGNLLTKGISNTHPSNVSTFTVNQAAAPLASFNGTISGNTNLVKQGAETTTLTAPASNFTGNVTVNNGTLAVGGVAANSGANSTLGAANLPGKTVTVNAAGILSFTSNNIFGTGNPNPNLPAVIINGGTLTSTRYNVLGNLTMNGGTLTQSSTDAGGYFGYHFRGSVTVGGSSPSTISTGNGSANHLAAGATFTVADATSSSANDLVVSAPLTNQSTDFASAAGSLTKDGIGTMSLEGINTYTGNTTVNAGTLALADNAQLRFQIGASIGINNQLNGSGSAVLNGDFAIDTTAAAALTSGSWVLENVPSLSGPYGASFQVVNTDGSPWTNSGDLWTKPGIGGSTWTFNEATGTLTVALGGYDSWANQISNPSDRDRADDPDGDGFTNIQEFLFGSSPIAANGSLVSSTKSGGNLTLEWLQRETGATYQLLESTTLANGSWTPSAVVPVAGDQTGVPTDYDRKTAVIPISGIRKFFRIEGVEN